VRAAVGGGGLDRLEAQAARAGGVVAAAQARALERHRGGPSPPLLLLRRRRAAAAPLLPRHAWTTRAVSMSEQMPRKITGVGTLTLRKASFEREQVSKLSHWDHAGRCD
jgi:hypothetical protein